MSNLPRNLLDHISECIELGDPKSAEQAARSAARQFPADPEAHNALGCALFALGDVPDACAAFEQAVRLAPHNVEIAANLDAARKVLDSAPKLPSAEEPEPEPQAERHAGPIRLLQMHTFYPSYQQEFYDRRPHLREAPFAEQMEAFLADAFSSAHMLTPHLAKLGYETMFVVANCVPAQARWLKDSQLQLPVGDYTFYDVLRLQIEQFKPDVLYMGHPVDFDSRFLRAVSWKPKLTIGWRAACVAPDTDWTEYDLIISHLRASRDQALRLGAKDVAFFHPGLPTWISDAVADEPRRFDVVFSGQWTEQHATRNAYLLALAAEAERDPSLSVGFYVGNENGTPPPAIEKRNQGPRWGLDMHRALRSGHIVVNAEIDLAQHDAGNMRLFETTGTGAFLLTEHHPNIARFFEPGHEIETFRSQEEMLAKVRYYLAHPDEREAIARRGLERCHREYAVELRAAEFDRIVRTRLGALRPEEARRATTVEADGVLRDAVDRVNAGEPGVARAMLERARGLRPDRPGAVYGHAFALAKVDRASEAAELLRTASAAYAPSPLQTALLREINAAQPDAGTNLTANGHRNGVAAV